MPLARMPFTAASCHLPESVLLRAEVLTTTASGQQLGEEQFHYFEAFRMAGSPHNSTSATHTSTLKLIQFSRLRVGLRE